MTLWSDAIAKVGPFSTHMLIDGERLDAGGRDMIETRDPGSGALLAQIAAGTTDDIDAAVEAANRALTGPWADMPPKDRSRLLWVIGEKIRENLERFTLVETLDTGKPMRDAESSVERTADFFCYYAGMADKLEGTSIPLGKDKVCFTEKVPVGVTGHIVPWNVPVSMVARSLAPALACGNTAVIKPAEDTPLTAIMLADVMEEAGLPKGVVNVVTGYGRDTGAALSQHKDVRHIAFTGSVATGKTVMTAAASHVASVTLELGGKSPHLVLRDADLEKAAPNVLDAVFKNAGQICSSGTRLLVDRPIHRQFVDVLVDRTEKMRLGHGLSNPDMGPLISPRQLQTVVGFSDRARARGLSILTGGEPAHVEECENGNFFMPTIVDNVTPDDELAQSEIFGPVLSVIPVDDLDQAIQIANDTAFGLAAGVHTRDFDKAMRYARGVEAGQVFINGYHSSGDTVPFGGMKESGIGREKGLAALDAYYELKAITVTI